MQQIVAIPFACLATVAIRLATLMVPILGVIGMTLIGAITVVVVVVVWRNHASGSEDNASCQRVKRKPPDETHICAPLIDALAFQRMIAIVGSMARDTPQAPSWSCS